MNLQVDWDQFDAFLQWLDPTEGAKHVFQIFTDKKPTSSVADKLAKAFADTASGARNLVGNAQMAGGGIFVQINQGTSRGKAGISTIRAVWVDTDGAPVQPILASGVVRPNAVVASSQGNYHIYWRVSDCSKEKFAEAQTHLAKVFRTDPRVKNLDRVMRVPGTWHLKDPDKPFQVTWRRGTDKVYTLDEILSSLPQPKSEEPSAQTPQSAASLITTQETYELPDVLPPGDRTGHLVAWIGKLVAQGYSEEYIRKAVQEANVGRCPKNARPIPDELLEREVFPAIARFTAQRQAQSAKHSVPQSAEDTGDIFTSEPKKIPTLDDWLKRFIYVEAGQLVIDMDASRLHSVYKLEEWKNAHSNKWTGDKRLVTQWMNCPERRNVRDITYLPGQDEFCLEDGMEFYNTYVGNKLAVPETADPAKTKLFLDHVRYLFPDKNDAGRFMQWLAFSVQHPEKRIPWAPLIVGRPGIGKGWLYQVMQRVFGPHNCSMIGPEDFKEDRQFNEWVSGKLLVCIDEMYTRKKWDLMDRLGRLMTEPTLMINHKHGRKGQEQVFANFLCFSNHDDAAALRENDRRFWVYKAECLKRDAAYYTRLFGWLESDGPAHLVAMLSSLDISDFSYADAPPMTEAKKKMIEHSRGILENCVIEAIQDKEGPFVADIISAEIVERYVMEKLGLSSLSNADRHQLRHCLVEFSYELPQPKYRIKLGPKSVRVRLRCLRDAEAWAEAEPARISGEYRRAWTISVGQDDPGRQNLEVMK